MRRKWSTNVPRTDCGNYDVPQYRMMTNTTASADGMARAVHLCTRMAHIFLIGYMGSGKTSLAPKLARRMGMPWLDLDELLSQKLGSSIADVFKHQGENYFREQEQSLLEEMLRSPEPFILSTGGGTPCFFDNMAKMKQNGITIYLHMSAAALASRLQRGRAHRPVIANVAPEDLAEFISHQLKVREPFYAKAHIKISGLSVRMEMLSERIETELKKKK